MAHPEDDARQSLDDTPRAAPIRITCPHCGHALDIIPMLATSPAADAGPNETAMSPAERIGHAALSAVRRRIFPLSGAVEHPREQVGQAPSGTATASPRSWGAILLVVLGIAVIGVLLIWLGQPVRASEGAGSPQVARATPAMLEATQVSGLSADETAILDTLTRYNSAESEAAALLTIEPLLPYIDPNGPFAQRRIAQVAERQHRNAPHRTILVRWAVGQIAIEGTTATVVTQETWSNQEAGAVAPEQATVRVTYTLRWEALAGRWLIVESEQIGL